MKVGAVVIQKMRLLHRIRGGAVFAVALLSSANAYAVSDRVKSACRNDYFQHCSQFAVGSDELRQCMRNVGEDLSAPCLVALVEDGEITKQDVERHNAAKSAAEKPKKLEQSAKSEKVARGDALDPKDVNTKSAKTKKAEKKKTKSKKAAASAEEPRKHATAKSGAAAKAVKTTKAHKPGTKVKTAKTKRKKAKVATATPSAVATHKVKTSGGKGKATAKAGTKAKPGLSAKKKTASKSKKIAKKKSSAKKHKKSLDGQASSGL
ncbi:MAG: hypothetical protein JSR99_02705 [Proteobacteria bacterium]|nr:hypothetical protein [Pseudomonadota bacterium]